MVFYRNGKDFLAVRLAQLIALVIISKLCSSALVSKSEINTCLATDTSTTCKSKILVNVVLQNGQGFNEAMGFNISKLADQNGQQIDLASPLRITLQKSPVEVSYNTLYLQDVNYAPQEQVIDSSYLTCSEGVYLGSLKLQDQTCTIQRDPAGNVIKQSQGYCCSCPLLTYATGIRTGSKRGDCGFLSNSMSAHCLNFPNIWFSLYEVRLANNADS